MVVATIRELAVLPTCWQVSAASNEDQHSARVALCVSVCLRPVDDGRPLVGRLCVNGRMTKTTPGQLATELGVSKIEMFNVMQELRINAKRMTALLTTSQEETLRTFFRNKATDRDRRYAAVRREQLSAPRSLRRVTVREFLKTCVCCDRRWIHRAEEDTPIRLCPICTSHYEQAGELIERRLARAESHAEMFREDMNAARSSFQKAFEERRVAYESRAKWRAALVEVVLDHDEGPDGLCWCGETVPCRTWRKLDEANKGIHRQVEKWSSWNEDRLEDFLYGDDRATRYVIDEDEPADDSDSEVSEKEA